MLTVFLAIVILFSMEMTRQNYNAARRDEAWMDKNTPGWRERWAEEQKKK